MSELTLHNVQIVYKRYGIDTMCLPVTSWYSQQLCPPLSEWITYYTLWNFVTITSDLHTHTQNQCWHVCIIPRYRQQGFCFPLDLLILYWEKNCESSCDDIFQNALRFISSTHSSLLVKTHWQLTLTLQQVLASRLTLLQCLSPNTVIGWHWPLPRQCMLPVR